MRALGWFGILFLGSNSLAFTLISNNPARYTGESVIVRIASHDCDQIGLSHEEVSSLVSLGVGQFWNSVSSSRLKFIIGETVDLASDASLQEMIDEIDNNQIVIGCSNNTDLFEATNILAVGTMTTSAPAKGVVAINNTPGSIFGEMSEANQRATLAHELGHAIGIGHSSYSHALMFFTLTEAIKRNSLARDDADAVTFLYPKESSVPLLLGACGTTGSADRGDFWFNLFFLLGTLLLAVRWLKVAPTFSGWERL